MTKRERLYGYLRGDDGDMAICANCKHFYQHYIQIMPRQYYAISCGHCVHPRNKFREGYDTCEHYEKRSVTT